MDPRCGSMHKALWDDGYPINGYFIPDNHQAAQLLPQQMRQKGHGRGRISFPTCPALTPHAILAA